MKRIDKHVYLTSDQIKRVEEYGERKYDSGRVEGIEEGRAEAIRTIMKKLKYYPKEVRKRNY